MDFADTSDLAVHLGSPPYTGTAATRAAAMLAKASALIRLTTGQDLEPTGGRIEEHVGKVDQTALFLRQRPVTHIGPITVAGVPFTDYAWAEWGTVEKVSGGVWDVGPIIVTYDSGWDTTSDQWEALKGITCEVAGRALTSSPAESNTFGPEVPSAVGWVPHLFLTPQEIQQLASLGPSPVG